MATRDQYNACGMPECQYVMHVEQRTACEWIFYPSVSGLAGGWNRAGYSLSTASVSTGTTFATTWMTGWDLVITSREGKGSCTCNSLFPRPFSQVIIIELSRGLVVLHKSNVYLAAHNSTERTVVRAVQKWPTNDILHVPTQMIDVRVVATSTNKYQPHLAITYMIVTMPTAHTTTLFPPPPPPPPPGHEYMSWIHFSVSYMAAVYCGGLCIVWWSGNETTGTMATET